MPTVRLYIATSVDGHIADADGGVDWLFENPNGEDADKDFGYASFYESVDVLVMGRVTYEQILGFGEWPYGGKPTYVFSRQPPEGEHRHVEFVSRPPPEVVEQISREHGANVWLVGGGRLVTSFRESNRIDEYILSIMPVLLGAGLPLFEDGPPTQWLELVESRVYDSGVVQLVYSPA